MPRKDDYITYNGVKVARRRFFDTFIEGLWPGYTYSSKSGYERSFIDAIREYMAGEKVVVIGGGWGVSSVVAASLIDSEGSVEIFEASHEAVERACTTVDLNNSGDIITVNHTVVGNDISLKGSRGEPTIISPTDIPKCDVLLIDCDGTEEEILSELNSRPEMIIVEHHAVGAEWNRLVEYVPDRINELLVKQGYKIIDVKRDGHHLGELSVFVAQREAEATI